LVSLYLSFDLKNMQGIEYMQFITIGSYFHDMII